MNVGVHSCCMLTMSPKNYLQSFSSQQQLSPDTWHIVAIRWLYSVCVRVRSEASEVYCAVSTLIHWLADILTWHTRTHIHTHKHGKILCVSWKSCMCVVALSWSQERKFQFKALSRCVCACVCVCLSGKSPVPCFSSFLLSLLLQSLCCCGDPPLAWDRPSAIQSVKGAGFCVCVRVCVWSGCHFLLPSVRLQNLYRTHEGMTHFTYIYSLSHTRCCGVVKFLVVVNSAELLCPWMFVSVL